MTTPARKPTSRTRTAAPSPPEAVAKPLRATPKPARRITSSGDAVSLDSAPASYRTVVIESVTPELDGGRYPVKREVGSTLIVEADVFKEGHDILAGRVCYRAPGETVWQTTPLVFHDNDR